jgi:hypothetical protein
MTSEQEVTTDRNKALLDKVLSAVHKYHPIMRTTEGLATLEIDLNRTNDGADIYAFLENGTCVARVTISVAEPPVL